MLRRLRNLVPNKTDREILTWFGGGVVVVVPAIWALVTYIFPHDDKKPAASATTIVTQSGTGIAAGRDINAPVNITGLNEKQVGQQVTDALKPANDRLDNLAAQIAQQKGVDFAPLRAILVKLGEAGVRDEDITNRLEAKADELIKLREEITKLRQGPTELASYAQQAQALIDKGDLDGARAALVAGQAAARGVREQSSRYEAQFLAQEAKVDHLQLAYRSASTKYADAARLMQGLDQQKQWEFVLAQAGELYSQGEEFADNPALVESIAVCRSAILLAPRSQRSLDWARTQKNLGAALQILGERESGTARLEEAVAADRAALEEMARARVPLDWAAAQMNLGNALRTLGERENGTARLGEAVAAYRAALEETTRARVPLDWGRTQMNLGIALARLGERESGTARLEEAVVAFRAALEERTRARVPLNWARTQMNLGNALMSLGNRESGTARLEEAVAAYRAALEEMTRTRLPLDWGRTQTNLGSALMGLGERESGTTRLEEAVAAYRAALGEMVRARVPLDWAASTGNQGVALLLIAQRRGDPVTAERALAQITAAFETCRDAHYARAAAIFEAQLPAARALVERLRKG
jgi:tetratricopeptide (TPR) repeat protein